MRQSLQTEGINQMTENKTKTVQIMYREEVSKTEKNGLKIL